MNFWQFAMDKCQGSCTSYTFARAKQIGAWLADGRGAY